MKNDKRGETTADGNHRWAVLFDQAETIETPELATALGAMMLAEGAAGHCSKCGKLLALKDGAIPDHGCALPEPGRVCRRTIERIQTRGILWADVNRS